MQQHMRIHTYWQASSGESAFWVTAEIRNITHSKANAHTYSCKHTYTLMFYKTFDGTSTVYINLFRHQEAPSSFSQFPYETPSKQQQGLWSHHEHHLLHYPGLQRLLEDRNGRCMDKIWTLLLYIQVHHQGFWPPWIKIFWALYSRPGGQWKFLTLFYIKLHFNVFNYLCHISEKNIMTCLVGEALNKKIHYLL